MGTHIAFLTQVMSQIRTQTPLTLIDAAAWTQFGLLITVIVTSIILWKGTVWHSLSPVRFTACAGALAAVFLVCVPLRTQLDVVFAGLTFDLIIIAVLVAGTGGSEVSAFVPLYLMLPTFGLVASEPLPLTAALYLFAGILFFWTLFTDRAAHDVFETPGNKLALALITIACCAGTFYIDTKSHGIAQSTVEELRETVAEYQLDQPYDELDQELTSLDYAHRRTKIESIRWKHVEWQVKFHRWYPTKDKPDIPEPKTLRFSVKPSRHPAGYELGSIDLRWLYSSSYPPTLEGGQELTVRGILVPGNDYHVTLLATELKE